MPLMVILVMIGISLYQQSKWIIAGIEAVIIYAVLSYVPIELAAFVLSIIAVKKERASLNYCSLIIGIITILFLLTHSLYIHD